MSQRKTISKLSVSSPFPLGGESLLPEPAVTVSLHRTLGTKNDHRIHQGRFSQKTMPIRQPGGKKPNRK